MTRDARRWKTEFGRWVAGYVSRVANGSGKPLTGVAGLVHDLSLLGWAVTEKAIYEWLSGRSFPTDGYASAMAVLGLPGGEATLYRHRDQVRDWDANPRSSDPRSPRRRRTDQRSRTPSDAAPRPKGR